MTAQSIYEKPIELHTLVKFTLPTMLMMAFTSLYTLVDGVVVSRFVGTDALSAINIVFPLITLISGVGFMFSTGGTAIVAKRMGEGRQADANSFLRFWCLRLVWPVFCSRRLCFRSAMNCINCSARMTVCSGTVCSTGGLCCSATRCRCCRFCFRAF